MIIKKQVTQIEQIEVKTTRIQNLLQLIEQQHEKPIEATYLFETQETESYAILTQVSFLVAADNEKPSVTNVEDDTLASLPFNVETLWEDKESLNNSTGAYVELCAAIYNKEGGVFYLLEDTKQIYTESLKPFIKALQTKSCIARKEVEKHNIDFELKQTRELPFTINTPDLFSTAGIRHTLKEVFDNRKELAIHSIVAILSINDIGTKLLAINLAHQQLIYQKKYEPYSADVYLEMLQHFMTEDFDTFNQNFVLQDT